MRWRRRQGSAAFRLADQGLNVCVVRNPRSLAITRSLWALRLIEARAAQDGGDASNRYSSFIPSDDGSVAAIVWPAGDGRAYHPLPPGRQGRRTVGVAADFYLDNRPWD